MPALRLPVSHSRQPMIYGNQVGLSKGPCETLLRFSSSMAETASSKRLFRLPRFTLKKESFPQVAYTSREVKDRRIGLERLLHILTCQLDGLLVKRLRLPRLAEVEGVLESGIFQCISQDNGGLVKRDRTPFPTFLIAERSVCFPRESPIGWRDGTRRRIPAASLRRPVRFEHLLEDFYRPLDVGVLPLPVPCISFTAHAWHSSRPENARTQRS